MFFYFRSWSFRACSVKRAWEGFLSFRCVRCLRFIFCSYAKPTLKAEIWGENFFYFFKRIGLWKIKKISLYRLLTHPISTAQSPHRKEQKPLLTMWLWAMLQKSFFRIKATDKNPLTCGFLKELRSMPSRRRTEERKIFLVLKVDWIIKTKKNFPLYASLPTPPSSTSSSPGRLP